MKVSVDLIRFINQKYATSGDPAPKGIDDLVGKIGAQLGGIDEVVALGERYKNVVVAKVMHCEDHPNASRLHICLLDDGGVAKNVPRDEHGYVQVVCGAPNVRTGLLVAWLSPGSTVPDSFDDAPFVLEARELRGVLSQGMLGSPKEMGISDSHEGILEIDKNVEPGTLFAEAYGLNDYIIDIENKMFTHRPDCFGVLGVAREIAGIQQQPFKSPKWYTQDAAIALAETNELKVVVKNELPELVPRFIAVPISGVTVGQSPLWLQSCLMRVGIRPINIIVDITNFLMMETGQPMHAYDYDKVLVQDAGAKHATLTVRLPKKGETLHLLNGKTIEPRDEAILIASANKPIGIGGVMGGADTEVDENTKNIILEVATFDMYSIRRTSMAHGLFTDAVTRYTKGQSPLQNMAVAAKAVDEIKNLAGGRVAGAVVDVNRVKAHGASLHKPVTVTPDFINERLGLRLTATQIKTLLTNVEFIVEVKAGNLHVSAPFWRTDIEIPEDIVEEVGRLYGYDHLPLELPQRDLTPIEKDPLLSFKTEIRDILVRSGANEVLSYSFVHSNLLEKMKQHPKWAFRLSNALSPELEHYRLSLTPSLLEKVHPNIKAGHEEFGLFEIGKMHNTHHLNEEGVPQEFESVAFVYANKQEGVGASYYWAQRYLHQLLSSLGINYGLRPIHSMPDFPILAPFEPRRSAIVMVGDAPVGIVGEYHAKARKGLKLPVVTAGFELSTSDLLLHRKALSYKPLGKFPVSEQDVCLRVAESVSYAQLGQAVHKALGEDELLATTIAPLDIYQRDSEPGYKQITFRITLQHTDRTLTTDEVNTLLEKTVARLSETVGVTRL